MDDKIAVIQEDPLGDIVAFHAERKLAHFLQLLGYFVRDRVPLARVRHGADDKKLCEGSNFAKIKDAKIVGFFRFSGASGGEPVWKLFARSGRWGVFETACQIR
jgi:hypothetical protein